ncbi:MAG: hypothetical protein A2977_00055 [Alphaproteobacteria bacterium RIFCSPLOWO2_01_FULL_45_8]|nr:MAG: hypothetical protein A2065_03500 [Alphaproteobacteria bacterium GWB1_45_5]OFW76202.1 MAG: hypothetical protein A3K20_01560 [Alphaproteobacteria bacterium GWA1_45_9]OFW89529.1 MAG: hypothetical protein A2621_01225 [Alphaproteobacteria bacterium RIFCSPHIGHO2_01_FULL_41_14]OFW95642.1 MAG: hypothetical protein A2977_00055 [Alphaproteobacteria bacterium RIFCSPLOWO2_01_FULL_45_8]
MKSKIKKFFQFLLAILSTVVLIGLAGLWRLSLSPIKFEAHSPILRHIPDSIQFSEIFLRAGRFYTIPELELQNVHFKTKEIEIKAPKLFATWNLWDVVRGDLRISSVRFEEPDVVVNPEARASPEETGPESLSMGAQLNAVFNRIPVKYLELTRAQISFYYEGTPHRINRADLYILKLSKSTTFRLSGFLAKGMPHPFDFKLEGRVDSESQKVSGEIRCEKIVPSDLPVPTFFQDYTRFYQEPLTIDVIFNQSPKAETFFVNGTIKFNSLASSPYVVFVKAEQKDRDQFSLTLTSPRLTVEALPKVWPLTVGEDIRKWVFDSLLKGTAHNINLNFVFQNKKDGSSVLGDRKGDLDVEGASVLYLKRLPVIEGLRAHVSFNKETASILVHQAHIKDLKIMDSPLNLSQFQEPALHLEGDIHFKGPFPTLVWYMTHDFFKKYLPGKMKAGAGQVKGAVHLSLPLKEETSPKEVVVDIDATLKKGSFSFQYGDQNLVLKNTDLTLYKKQDILKVSGTGNVGGFQSSFLWEEDYQEGASIKSRKKVKGSGAFKGLLDILPPFLQAHIQTQKGGDAVLSFASEENKEGVTKVDLDLDLTNASVVLPLLNWGKSKGEPAKLEIDLETKNSRIYKFKQLSFMSKGLKIQGNVRFDDQGKVSELYFSPLLINGLKGEGRAVMKNGIWDVVAKVPLLNFNSVLSVLQSLQDPEKKKDGVSLNLNLKVNTLFFKQNYVYKNLEIISKIRKDDLHFLKVSGDDRGSPFSIRYEPHQDEMVLEVEIPRLDTFLEGLDISNHIKSKKVEIQASKPLNDLESPIKGKLFIEQLRILNAPGFAKLLSLISIEGLVRALNGDGLVFTDNYAKFEYKDQQIALRRAHMMNSAIGITAKGYMDLKGKTLNLEGVLVPANFLNQLLGKIPLIGTLLTGEKDQGLFSVSYTAKGDIKNPDIKSNPLGVIAPNILKSFFEDLTGGKKPKPTLGVES